MFVSRLFGCAIMLPLLTIGVPVGQLKQIFKDNNHLSDKHRQFELEVEMTAKYYGDPA